MIDTPFSFGQENQEKNTIWQGNKTSVNRQVTPPASANSSTFVPVGVAVQL